jgi:hypothetical protein
MSRYHDFQRYLSGKGPKPESAVQSIDTKKLEETKEATQELLVENKPPQKEEIEIRSTRFKQGLSRAFGIRKVFGSSIKEHFQTGSLAGTASVSVLIGAGIRAAAKSMGAEEVGVGLSAGIGAAYGAVREGILEYKRLNPEQVIQSIESKNEEGKSFISKIFGAETRKQVLENLPKIAISSLKGAVAGVIGAVAGDYAAGQLMDKFQTKADLASETQVTELANSAVDSGKSIFGEKIEMHDTVWKTAKEMLDKYSKSTELNIDLSDHNIDKLKDWILTKSSISENYARLLQQGKELDIPGAETFLNNMFDHSRNAPKLPLHIPDVSGVGSQIQGYGQGVLSGIATLVGAGGGAVLGEVARKGWGWLKKKHKDPFSKVENKIYGF